MNFEDCEINYESHDVFDPTLSVYIPIIIGNISQDKIINLFKKLDIGLVSRVDFVNKFNKKGKLVKEAFIHFEKWYNTASAENLQARIKDPNINAKLVYDDPKYWPILPAHNPAQEQPKHIKEQNVLSTHENGWKAIRSEYLDSMYTRIRSLEEVIKKLNIENTVQEENIKYLENINKLITNNGETEKYNKDSWENLSGELNLKSTQNKRAKSTPYQILFGQSKDSLFNSILSRNSLPVNAENNSLDKSSNVNIKNVNPSCCGEISNAWFPDYPPPPPSSPCNKNM